MLPHLGASTAEANLNAARRAAEQLIAYDRRGVTKYVVNKGVPEGLDETYQELAYHLGYMARHYLGSYESVTRIECSFYGELGQFAQWLLPSVVAGVAPDFEAGSDIAEAESFLDEMGITYQVRDVDNTKGYGESISVDLFEGKDTIKRASLRGTVAEGLPVVSRINDFDRLYIEVKGHSLFAIYPDRPGVMAKITAACAEADLNIEDMRCPHNQTRERSVAMLRTNRPVPANVVERIRADVDPEVVFAVSLK
jgi:D-3-phosphoglycerate dehydrogenase